ncbi:MAG: hypothetical protein WC975_14625 [Phycisphaerae bacterium]
MSNASLRFCLAVSMLLGVIAFAGCQNTFTHDRWEMIQVGSADKHDVQATLGDPQEKPFKDLWWYYKGNNEAKIYFSDKDTVKAKKWINERTGQIECEPKGWIEK